MKVRRRLGGRGLLPLLWRSRRTDNLGAVTSQVLSQLLHHGHIGWPSGRWGQRQCFGWLAEPRISEVLLDSARSYDGEHTDYFGLESIRVR
jgi:hypothetical protein